MICKSQKKTCMYSKEELETFSQGKLTAIYTGIQESQFRRPWRTVRSRRGSRSIQNWCESIKK